MGMPCQINSIVKLDPMQFPLSLVIDGMHTVQKSGYRIYPIDVPLQLVDDAWLAHADVVITQLTWAGQQTIFNYRIHRIYDQLLAVK
jgi:Protein of unknown function (DUF2584)